MNSRHRRTLLAVFSDPVAGSIAWSDIESLLVSVGDGRSRVVARVSNLKRMVNWKAFTGPIPPRKQSAIKSAPPGPF